MNYEFTVKLGIQTIPVTGEVDLNKGVAGRKEKLQFKNSTLNSLCIIKNYTT